MRSAYCEGEVCFCGAPADHKVAEVIFGDDAAWESTRDDLPGGGPRLLCRHPLTAYVCHTHFRQLMGPAAGDAP